MRTSSRSSRIFTGLFSRLAATASLPRFARSEDTVILAQKQPGGRVRAERLLAAEAAADALDHHVDVAHRHAHGAGHCVLRLHHALRAADHGVLVALLWRAEGWLLEVQRGKGCGTCGTT